MGEGSVRRLSQSCRRLADKMFSNHIREPMAEFLGTMVFVMFGTGVDCQTVLSSSSAVSSGPKGVGLRHRPRSTLTVGCRIGSLLVLAGVLVCSLSGSAMFSFADDATFCQV